MLRFFQKMRQALVPENRFGRYFFYAVGEIVLVVIGILIALQINNWNQLNSNNKIVDDYLVKIVANINSDIKTLESLTNERRELLTLCDTINRYFEVEYISNQKLFFKGFSFLTRENSFFPNTSAYESLKNSGFMNNLKNSEIEDRLSSYYYLMERVLFVEGKFNNSIQHIENSLTEKGFWTETKRLHNSINDTIYLNYESLKKYPEVETVFYRGVFFLDELIENYTNLIEEGKKVTEIIKRG